MKHIYGYGNRDFGWIRVFGYGIAWKNLKYHGLTFSQRYGYRKYLRLGNMVLTFLKR